MSYEIESIVKEIRSIKTENIRVSGYDFYIELRDNTIYGSLDKMKTEINGEEIVKSITVDSFDLKDEDDEIVSTSIVDIVEINAAVGIVLNENIALFN